jgi:hypothetical protein
MDPIIIAFDLKLARISGAEQFCPDFSKEYKKQETIDNKKKEWLEHDWEYSVAATTVTGIVTPSGDITVDTVTPATPKSLISFVTALTDSNATVICEHFSARSAVLLAALFRIGGTADAAFNTEVTTAARRLYDMRRKALDMVFPFLDGKGNDTVPNVHNPIRALRLEELPHPALCTFAGLPLSATRLTIQRKLAHRVGITSVN